jgi:two-component system cell cycle sensor histidine kinase/response regulator CckA
MSPTVEAHRALVEHLPLVTYMVRLEAPTRAVFVSPQIEPVFGFTTQDFEAPDFWQRRMAPHDLPGFLAAFEELRANHGQMSIEYRVTTGEGREVWVRDVGLVDRGDDGELYVHGYLTDVTREKELEREQEQYRRLIEQLPLVTYVNTLLPGARPRPTYVSPQIEELLGYPAELWIDNDGLWDRIVHPDDFELVTSGEQLARERGEPFELEYRIVRSDGVVRWVLDQMRTVYDADRKPLFEQGFLVDVTERKESANLFQAVFDGAFEAMIISNDEGTYVDVNPAACELIGRTREELLGERLGSVSGTTEEIAQVWRSLLEDGVAKGQHEFTRPDGSVREVEFSARAHALPGLHIAVLRDVTERQQLERDLWRAQRLESVGRLAGGVAQDFNNLLTAIRGYAQLLLARVEPGGVEHHHALEIDHAADRAAALTAQLLAFGRRQVLQARPAELNRLVENLEDVLSRLVGDDVGLVFELDHGVNPVRIDPGQIEQVLVNLVVNAAEVTPAGGRVVVRTANAGAVALDDMQPGRYVVLSVEDSGSGIEAQALDHLFEPFFTTKDVGGGVGLGLATAYGIAKQSGGTISVTTAAGVGSTFAVYLPEASAPVTGGDTAPGTGETIVVVESDPAVRDVLFEVLSDAGYRAVTTATPADARRVSERLDRPIDLVVTELDEKRAAALASSLGAVKAVTLQKPYSPELLRHAVGSALAVTRSGDPDARFGVSEHNDST